MRMWSRLAGTSTFFLVMACSGAPGSTATSSEVVPDLVVTLSEWRFGPQDAAITSGRRAVVELRNTGTILHEWTLVAERVESEEELAGAEILATQRVNPGAVTRIELQGVPAGVYAVVCPIPGHIASGMVGTLTVES